MPANGNDAWEFRHHLLADLARLAHANDVVYTNDARYNYQLQQLKLGVREAYALQAANTSQLAREAIQARLGANQPPVSL